MKIIEDNFKEKVVLFKNKNTGYTGGANKGIELSNGEYVIIANPDIVFGENYIEKCINKFSEDEAIGAVIGKLLKYDFDTDEKLNVIDSAGISFNHYRQGIDIGQIEVDEGMYEEDI